MKKIFAVMLVLTLLTSVFLFTLVDAKSNDVLLTRQNIEINQGISKNYDDVNSLKGIEPVVKVTLPPTAIKEPVITLPSLPEYEKLKGTLFNFDSSKERFLLKTEKAVYELIGNTKGLEKEIGKTVVVSGNYVYTLIATEYPLFNVESYTVIDIPEITPEPNLQTITGTLSVTKYEAMDKTITPYAFLLQTQSGPVSLSGKTEGLEKYDGFEVEVTGTYSMLTIYPPIFIVESYKPILAPTPTPDVKIITMADNGGYVYVKPGDELRLELESNPTTGYSWSYATKPDPKVLIETNYEYIPDKTDEEIVGSGGKEIWSYKAVYIGSTAIEMIYSRPWESKAPAKTFTVKVIVEELQTIRGTVVVTKNDNPEQKAGSYNFLLKTQTGPVTLSGKTEGLEKYDGLEVEVTGTYSPLKIYPPIFIVESYKPVASPIPTSIPVPTVRPIPIPTIRPEPTAVPLSKTHTIISEKVLGIAIPGVTFSNISGYTTISWTEGSTNAFFNSKINADKDVYELELVSVEKSDSYEIVGLFNIKKNGKLLVKELNGRLYGLSNDEGDYFKFYSEGEKYHMSAYITKRIDF
ncbi:MAG TPA: protease inhibitor I42 family protein [Acetivibrio clariflavus]|nr:protease inhibitor I42 family protein [Acetivibrio clariflavus]